MMQRKSVNKDRKFFFETIAKNKYVLNLFPSKVQQVLLKSDEDLIPFHPTILIGEPGTGKTIRACKMLLGQIEEDYIMQRKAITYGFTTLSNYLQLLRQEIGENTDKTAEKLRQVNYLILDDIAVDKVTEWTYEKFYDLVNFRYENQLPTIYTSNLSMQQLMVTYDMRIIGRIKEQNSIILMKGKSWR